MKQKHIGSTGNNVRNGSISIALINRLATAYVRLVKKPKVAKWPNAGRLVDDDRHVA